MAFDLQEQEQIAELKAFWHDYGRHIALGLGIAVAIYGGWKGWQAWENKQSTNASVVYAKLDSAAGDAAKIKAATEELKKDYSRTAYAGRAALVSARAAFWPAIWPRHAANLSGQLKMDAKPAFAMPPEFVWPMY